MITFQVPAGPMNLATLFPGIDFTKVEEYFIQVETQAMGTLITTPTYKRGCCCNDDTMRIFFLNYLGGIDGVNFKRILKEHETKSDEWRKPLKYPLEKWDGGKQRFNVMAGDTVTAENSCYAEPDQEWLMELVDSPNAWVQWLGTQGQDNDYIPIKILDGKFITRKSEGRYEYILTIQFEYANEKIILRN